ncbi:hypothetical protein KCH_75000 [Kitasatospora cheerisanensis KCTC 2395]|uniref:Uncharacterized protein n=1 Tax=Kitasatospora cheerisanensis KCTC 2395 TaxID=1348663 RepID=A0A066YS47_9ACTN|nr:hypothetical protein KCH_75000 [Kitasatospora cheerisanensis KCTC 2395]
METPPQQSYPTAAARLTIRVSTVKPDGTRTLRSTTSSDELIVPTPLSTFAWPACECPRHRPVTARQPTV